MTARYEAFFKKEVRIDSLCILLYLCSPANTFQLVPLYMCAFYTPFAPPTLLALLHAIVPLHTLLFLPQTPTSGQDIAVS